MAKWARQEQARKIRAERRVRFLGHTRAIFVLLFIAAIWVFVFNHQVEVQSLTVSELHKITNKTTLSDHLRRKALDYEKQVDQISQ